MKKKIWEQGKIYIDIIVMYKFFFKEPKDTTHIKIHVVEAQKSGTEKGPCRKKIKHGKKKKKIKHCVMMHVALIENC